MSAKRLVTDFELSQFESDAKIKIVCQKCFGVGQLHFSKPIESFELCPMCAGDGRAAREPHVIRLVAEVRSLLSQLGE